MDFTQLQVTKELPIAIIKLNRPEAMNALNSKMVSELVDALTELEKDDEVRCLVITGDERAFSAGADIKEMVGLSTVDLVKTRHFFPLWDKIGHYPKPVVAALSGYVLGGGLELAMSCDILIAAEGTRLGQPEINIGVMPGGGGTQRLTRIVGKHKAMEMVLTGNMITAEEAKGYGLINKVVPQEVYLTEAKKIAMEIASKGPVAVRLAKEAVLKAYETSLNEGLDFERKHFFMLFSTEDMKEGMNAFIEKRKPNFRGR
jgi:enoyl-CoA hydratase